MNHLLIGTDDKTARLLDISSRGFLLIDDGPIADAFVEKFNARTFDPTLHSFNPLRGMDYKRARDFATALYAATEGRDTLTVRNGKRALVRLLLAHTRLDTIHSTDTDPGTLEALATIDDLLLSPVLRSVLCNPPNFRLRGSVVVKLDRATLGDFDAFVLASLLIGQSKGHVIVPDFGFYACPLHLSLMRQGRLTAGVQYLTELEPRMRQAALSIKDKWGSGTTYDDAVVLAGYARLVPGTNEHTDFVHETVGFTTPPASP